jgi:predicted transcriptional regulator
MATTERIGRETIIRSKRVMTMSEGKKKQQIIQNTLRLATCSELRRDILVSLGEGEKALRELREELEVSSTTAIHALRELEKDNFVFQDEDRAYTLTKIGEVIALKLSDFVDVIEVLKKHEDFWLTHDFTGIPPHLLEKIGWLRDSTLIEAPATDVLKIFTNFVDILKNAKEIRGVTSMFIPEFRSLLKELTLEKNVDVELILTKEILEEIDKGILNSIFADKDSKLKLYRMKENMNVAFTVTDYLISFGLFDIDGTYDWNKDLISYNRKAIEWGRELFEWYRKRAELFIVNF